MAYAQNIFWGDGVNVLNDYFTYYYESAKTDDISETNHINQNINLQKNLSNGDFALEKHRTVIDENLPILCEKLLTSSDKKNTKQRNIRDNEGIFQYPEIFSHGDELSLFWSKPSNNLYLFKNIIDSDGNLAYFLGGIGVLDLNEKIGYTQEIIGDKSIIVSSKLAENDEIKTCYQEFDLAGNPTTEEIYFHQSEYLNNIGIFPCDDTSYYIYATYTNSQTSNTNTLIQKISDNDFVWENPLIIEGFIENIINNIILYYCSEHPISELDYAYFDNLGNLINITVLDYSVILSTVKVFMHYEKTFISWNRHGSDMSKIQYIDENGNYIWSSPLSINLVDEMFVEENKISTVKYTYENTAQFSAYDFEKNILVEHQFDIDWNSNIFDFSINKVGEIFVIVAVFYCNNQDNEIKYSVIHDTGSTLLYFGEDTFCGIIDPTQIDQIVQNDKILYVLFSNQYQYEDLIFGDYYIQKMDFSDYTISNDNDIIKPVLTSIAYPNPFNPTVNISYNLPNDSSVSLEIFNLKGQKIKTILTENQKAGNHQTIWQGKDENEKRVSSGIYFYKLKTDLNEKIKKIMLMK